MKPDGDDQGSCCDVFEVFAGALFGLDGGAVATPLNGPARDLVLRHRGLLSPEGRLRLKTKDGKRSLIDVLPRAGAERFRTPMLAKSNGASVFLVLVLSLAVCRWRTALAAAWG